MSIMSLVESSTNHTMGAEEIKGGSITAEILVYPQFLNDNSSIYRLPFGRINHTPLDSSPNVCLWLVTSVADLIHTTPLWLAAVESLNDHFHVSISNPRFHILELLCCPLKNPQNIFPL